MKVNIEELIEEHRNFLSVDGSGMMSFLKMLRNELKKENDVYATIQTMDFIDLNFNMIPDWKKYFVAGIFELGHIDFPSFSPISRFVLILLTKNKPKKIKISAEPKTILEKEKIRGSNGNLQEYYSDLEAFINFSRVSDRIKPFVNTIDYEIYKENFFKASLYSPKYVGLMKSLRKQKCALLKDLVNILRPDYGCRSKKMVKTVTKDFFSYPLNIKELPKCRYYGIQLQKGDIVYYYGEESLSGNKVLPAKSYLIAETPNQELTSETLSSCVLRLKSNLITPEYLFMYMQSEKFKSLNPPDVFIGREKILGDSVVLLPNSDVPMALNKELSRKYRDLFNEKFRPYLVKKSDYYGNVQRPQKKVVHEDAVLDEYLEWLKDAHKRELLYFINENLREMNVCVSGQAYNTAIVVTGSILEAVLTDWLGEIEGKNYFKEPFRVVNENGRNQPRYLSLNDAISKIAKIMKKWNEKEKAIAIRELRNRVHARVFLEQNKKITKRECETAQKNLNSVIKSRYSDFEMREMN